MKSTARGELVEPCDLRASAEYLRHAERRDGLGPLRVYEGHAPLPLCSPVEGEEVGSGIRFRALLCVLLMSFAAQSVHAAEQRLTVLSYPERPAKLPLWLAQEAGLFKKYGLNVEIKTPTQARRSRKARATMPRIFTSPRLTGWCQRSATARI